MQVNDFLNFINQVSIDCVIFGYQENNLKVLIPKLVLKGDLWTLPSGFIKQEESIDQAALRVLEERTGIRNVYLDQFRVFGEVPRTNKDVIDRIFELNQGRTDFQEIGEPFFDWLKQRFISIGYYALVNADEVIPHTTFFDESADWYDVDSLPTMVLDHNDIVAKALEALRINFDNKLIGFNLLPEKFTMKELQQLYETVYDKPFRSNNFQKKMLDLNVLERLEKKFTGAANKAPYLYRFKS
ncbi:NUDIX domain-containing protein [Algoriphagus sp. D3-2-R+10]|uniref:NUDIX hydrolase n=1 Tax=Algoriphagus aurantiacus TaxID=3103948 RepID=UPI002B3C021E|nr:NUDIX domain-containing protein [Algoriphagus sp. D3-2-R+10]MEB2774131.1 NUDIX domain-containing protein [Algoriphagus sp. D3-2-R+10]